MPEAFDFRELVSLCASSFDSKHTMIQVVAEGRNHVLLMLKVFGKIL